ncbi:MAG: DedA family protein [Patescibacteria group bacterium]
MENFIDFFLQISQDLGYGGIIFLMAIESSFIPFPSEIIITPAAYLASQGSFNIFFIIISGIIGSLIGAIINYFLALYLGRLLIYKLADSKFGKLILLNSKKINKAENYFLNYGSLSTFIGRLIPVIRQLISLPAGFAKMNFIKFIIFTALGSGIWVSFLAIVGYIFGANQEIILNYFKEISLIVLLIVIIIFIIIKFRKYIKFKNPIIR